MQNLPSLKLRGSNQFQHGIAFVHKARSIKCELLKGRVKELEKSVQSADFNPTEHLWDELKH